MPKVGRVKDDTHQDQGASIQIRLQGKTGRNVDSQNVVRCSQRSLDLLWVRPIEMSQRRLYVRPEVAEREWASGWFGDANESGTEECCESLQGIGSHGYLSKRIKRIAIERNNLGTISVIQVKMIEITDNVIMILYQEHFVFVTDPGR